jgi:hypothetical protein
MNRIGGTLKGLTLGWLLNCVFCVQHWDALPLFPNDLVTKEAVNC